MTYASAEIVRYEVYLASFSNFTNKMLVSRGGGMSPQWRPDGAELFWLSRDGRSLMKADSKREPALEVSLQSKLFNLPSSVKSAPMHPSIPFDATEVGERFVMVQSVQPESTVGITIV